jgi:hypothetical protein
LRVQAEISARIPFSAVIALGSRSPESRRQREREAERTAQGRIARLETSHYVVKVLTLTGEHKHRAGDPQESY